MFFDGFIEFGITNTEEREEGSYETFFLYYF